MFLRLKIVGLKIISKIGLIVFHQSRLAFVAFLWVAVLAILASIHADSGLSRLQKSWKVSWFLRQMFRSPIFNKGLCRFSKLTRFLRSMFLVNCRFHLVSKPLNQFRFSLSKLAFGYLAFWLNIVFVQPASSWVNFVLVGKAFDYLAFW